VQGRPVADDVGMTGEITLTGQVLPIGGVREKTLAAQRAGLRRVILPSENEPDLVELPPETRDAIDFTLVDHVEQVLDAAFDGVAVRRRGPRAAPERQAALPAR
jgi:ATP-dependent Lon protease